MSTTIYHLKITEEQFENHLLGILGELGYVYENGYEIAPDTARAERKDYREVVRLGRLRETLTAFNPDIPAVAIEDAIASDNASDFPSLIQNNRHFTVRPISAEVLSRDDLFQNKSQHVR